MAKIIIDNHKFDYNVGCQLLKLRYGNKCPFSELDDIWEDIKPLTFSEISMFENIEERRIGINCLGIERLVNEIYPTLVDTQTIEKTTTWVDDNGELIKHNFADTYELFKVSGELLGKGFKNSWEKLDDAYYIRCKDTSTDREYLIWIEPKRVMATNTQRSWWHEQDFKNLNSIACIAWTIQTDVPKGNIEKILRQGDCILIKPMGKYEPLTTPRHLTEDEYRTLLVAES